MKTIAYIANEFPSPVEPYVAEEIAELRRHGIRVICCSGKRVSPIHLSLSERALWKETRYFQPLCDDEILRAMHRLAADRDKLAQLLKPLLWEPGTALHRRIRAIGHTVMGAALAEQLAPLDVEHIHAHHGYFASWMALTAASLLGIGFSFTLHGSDLLQRADLLSAKLQACQFCVTVSEFNRQYILRNYPSIPASKITVQRLGVDRVPTRSFIGAGEGHPPPFRLLSVGRLHRVKDYCFLIKGCGALRDRGNEFVCTIVGEGPERSTLEKQIAALGLRDRVHLIGQVPHPSLADYYRYADLVVLTSKSEGIPVVLMEAMAHERLVLAPAITGIPELVDHQRTGFLYEPGSLPDFVDAVQWIHDNQSSLAEIQHAAAVAVDASYNRQRNLRSFAKEFITRVSRSDIHHAHPLFEQVRLPV
jgi:colanic acid/amylovoran biosynthesis glycosyltransferase